MFISSPLSVQLSRNKKFILNLNGYRNAHYQTLNKAKAAYKSAIADQVMQLPKMNSAILHYILYPATKRRTDIGNVVAVHKKFFEDALVGLGIIPDDDYTRIIGSSERFGFVDRDNPRVVVVINKLS